MNYLTIKNWQSFQQYKDRDPKWIKLHRDLLDDYEFEGLDEVAQLHLVKIWLLAAKLDNQIPNDATWIGRKIGAKAPVDLKQLINAGFLICTEVYTEFCTETYLETETEEEREGETERETRKPRKRGQRLPTDWRPDEELLQWAMTERTDLDIKKTIDSFTDYWQAKTGAAATKLDWDATFRNWVRNERSQRQTSNRETSDERRAREADEHRRRILAN